MLLNWSFYCLKSLLFGKKKKKPKKSDFLVLAFQITKKCLNILLNMECFQTKS